jgi:hypothetical protein
MPNRKNEQLSLSEYTESQAKKGKKKKLIDLPWAVKLVFAVPLVFFVILLLGYIFYIRRFAAHG